MNSTCFFSQNSEPMATYMCVQEMNCPKNMEMENCGQWMPGKLGEANAVENWFTMGHYLPPGAWPSITYFGVDKNPMSPNRLAEMPSTDC